MGLFNFFKNSNTSVFSPINGFCVDISKCEDEMFSNRLLGDGFMVVPTSNTVCSPCFGKLTMLFPSLHAFGITMDDSKEILVHIGINTVELNGKYFEKLCDINSRVSPGTPIIKYDYKKIIAEGYDANVLVVCVNNKEVVKENINKDVEVGEVIIK